MDNVNEEKKEKKVPDNMVGIRATLNNMGISNEKIGFDNANGNVTLNGKAFLKPGYYDDEAGVTYSPIEDIRKGVVDFYKNSSNPVVRVSDAYATALGPYGLASGGLSYSNGTVSIGGQPLDTMFIDESGKAWARQDDVYSLANRYAESLGAKTPNEIYDRFDREYLSDIRSDIDELRNRDEFSYNPDDDSVYLAYRNKYLREGNRASRNAMADYSALTGGYTNSAAVTAGALANQYYAQQLTDKIPELAEQAYQRYYDDYTSDIDILDKMIDLYDKAYTDASYANNQTVDNANYASRSVVMRDDDAYDRSFEREKFEQEKSEAEYDREMSEFERGWAEILNDQKYRTGELENYWTDILNTGKAAETDLRNKGYMLDNEEQSIYIEYYRRLLESELANDEKSREKTDADIWKIYAGL